MTRRKPNVEKGLRLPYNLTSYYNNRKQAPVVRVSRYWKLKKRGKMNLERKKIEKKNRIRKGGGARRKKRLLYLAQ
jgi:hypothetical protein